MFLFIILDCLDGAFLAKFGILLRYRILSVFEKVRIALDGLTQHRLDKSFEPGAGGYVSSVLPAEMESVPGQLVNLGCGGHPILVVEPGPAGDLDSYSGGDDYRDVEVHVICQTMDARGFRASLRIMEINFGAHS